MISRKVTALLCFLVLASDFVAFAFLSFPKVLSIRLQRHSVAGPIELVSVSMAGSDSLFEEGVDSVWNAMRTDAKRGIPYSRLYFH